MKCSPKILAWVVLLFPSLTMADTGWLIATSSESLLSGEKLKLEIVRPDESTPWPETLRLKIISDRVAETVACHPDKGSANERLRRTYMADLPLQKQGLLKIELAEFSSNRLLISVSDSADPIAAMTAGSLVETPPEMDPMPENEPALSAYEPVYFLVGGLGGFDAQFQLSFKYRLFDPESVPVKLLPVLSGLHFGYSQTSLWDLSADSKPLRDTSYRPSLFWQSRLDETAIGPAYLRAGYEHESNGKDGLNSRSIDMLFVQPIWQKNFADGNSLLFLPRFYGYLRREDRPDIAGYRGYVDWMFRYGDERDWLMTSRIRTGTAGHMSTQLDFSKPLRNRLFAHTGGFLHFQLFNGYGDSILDYNLRSPTQLRAGFSIVR